MRVVSVAEMGRDETHNDSRDQLKAGLDCGETGGELPALHFAFSRGDRRDHDEDETESGASGHGDAELSDVAVRIVEQRCYQSERAIAPARQPQMTIAEV